MMPTIDQLIDVIEKAARSSVPWPDDERYMGEDENGEDIYRAVTLEEFVEGTYIHDSAEEVFRAAASAAAKAVDIIYMTKHRDPATPDSDRPAFEIEITEEMVTKAASVIYEWTECPNSKDLAEMVLISALHSNTAP